MGSMKLRHAFIAITIWLIMADLVASNVVVMGKNITLTFDDVEANFAPPIKGSGICGTIYVSDPLDACNPLTNKAPESQFSPFALIIRGNCTFDEKVRNAQNAGYKAAIVYDNEDYNPLVSMAGSSTGIHIYAVFISHESGQTLTRYAGRTDIETWLIPTFSNSAWSIVAISFISLLAMSAVLATCFFVRRHRVRRERPPRMEERDRDCMTSQLVNAMPAVLFNNNNEHEKYCTGFTCAICLEDYSIGDRLRVLPCRHKFHVMCVDMWLTSWRTFCPVCKRDARANSSFHSPPPSETTPLLSSSNSLHSNLSNSPSIHSSLPPRSHSRVYTQNPNHHHHHNNNNNRINGLSTSYNNNNSRRHSPPISIGRSSTYADFRVVSSSHSYRGAVMTPSSSPQRRYGSHLTASSSPLHQYGSYMVTSPLPYRYGSHMMTSPSPHHQNGSHVMTSSPLYQYGSQVMVSSSSLHGAQTMTSSLPYRYGSPYNGLGSSVESSGYNLGSSDRQSYLRHCEESGASLSEMASAQSLPDC